jgi:ABC-type transporter MlaC component
MKHEQHRVPAGDVLAAPSAGTDALRFLRAWAAAPWVIGAQLPGGRQLARATAAAVDPAAPLAIVMLALAALLAPAARADPGPATAHIQRLLAEGQRVAAGPDREAQLGRLLDRDFDVDQIARTALGAAYARMSEAERTECLALFREQIVLSMVRQVVLTPVQDVAIIEARDLATDSMIVTRMVDAQGRVQLANWRVRAEGGRPKIVGIVMDGAGLGEALRVALQRGDGQVSALLAALRAQNAQMRAQLR